ncbi:MAG: Hsp70 family protein, partial [Myxococcota bacterium]|nr:Hsp70 family protein [Myxococcota bacterium]
MVDTGGTRGCEREVGKAIGIDLGTTNSCTAIMEGGEPRILTHRSDTNLIPSVVALNSEENLVVGSEARELSRADPAACVTGAKRLIGRSFTSSTVERIREFCPYELVEGDQAQVKVRLHDKVLSVEEISAAILRKLVDLSEQDLGAEVTQAVITVPAYFNDRQRQAVRAAAELADIEVLRILNEPTAAALAYSLGKHLSRNIAVYDLGGGTFDVSVIQVQGSVLEVSATGGDTFLGGIDFDNRVIKHVLETFRDQNDIDLSNDAKALRRLAEACENAKVELSQEET